MPKEELYQYCLNYLQDKIDRSQQAINELQESSNKETKSSAGDKYETSRAMIQLEKDKHARQLATHQKEFAYLKQIKLQETDRVDAGSLVTTSIGHFFIGISAGKTRWQEKEIYFISLASPIGQAIAQKSTGDTVLFRERNITILSIQ